MNTPIIHQHEQIIGQPERMEQWVNSGSWVPPIAPAATTNPYASMGYANRALTYVSSDCGAVGDSGYYGSGPAYSFQSTSSIQEEEESIDPRFIEQLNDINVAFTMQPSTALPQENLNPLRLAPDNSKPHVKDTSLCCSHCGKKFRTRCEQRKHWQRHEKPYRCDHKDCKAIGKGFSSSNDLARHKKTVHLECAPGDVQYICRHGSCGQKDPLKLWLRTDNFRSHLFRIHGVQKAADSQLGEYIYRPTTMNQELNGVGTAIPYVDMDPQSSMISIRDPTDGLGDTTMSVSSFPGRASTSVSPHFDMIDEMLHTLEKPADESRMDMRQVMGDEYIRADILNQYQFTTPAAEALADQNRLEQQQVKEDPAFGRMNGYLNVEEREDFALSDDVSETEDEEAAVVPESHLHDEFFPKLLPSESSEYASDVAGNEADSNTDDIEHPDGAAGSSIDWLRAKETLGSLPMSFIQSYVQEYGAIEERKTTVMEVGARKKPVVCSSCGKAFQRLCELKKHKKRHEKPYGCTHYQCSRKFGSKNDWKRHENSQHPEPEAWSCGEKGCVLFCHGPDSLKSHLRDAHRLVDEDVIDERVANSRLGRRCDSRFWCGFCVRVIEIAEGDIDMWTKRYDHIDDHLFGKRGLPKNDISAWRYIERLPETSSHPKSKDASLTMKSTSGSMPGVPAFASLHPERASGKRLQNNDMNPRLQKRTRPGEERIWNCCHCQALLSQTLSTQCMECSHFRCNGCHLEVGEVDDNINPALRQNDRSVAS